MKTLFVFVAALTLLTQTQASTTESPVLIAVIDTGIDIHHPFFKKRIWNNPGERGLDHLGRDKRTNGVDDDSNGFIDDVHGWNFAKKNSNISDDNGHGTHVAGLIIAGAAPRKIELIILKYYDRSSSPERNVEAYLAALNYAVKSQAKIINFSGGGPHPILKEKQLLQVAQKQSQIFVTALGNNGTALEDRPFFPASYGDLVIGVEALNQTGSRLLLSNFKKSQIGPAAIGESVVSSIPGGGVGTMTGTSQAAALYSGAVAKQLP